MRLPSPAFRLLAVALLAVTTATDNHAQPASRPLRLLSWADYVPAEVKAQFEKETGYKVEVTLASNDEMVAKLRSADDKVGFDLAQPSLDRVYGTQKDHKLYRPLDFSRIKAEAFNPDILAATQRISTWEGKAYAVPHVWGADGLVVNLKTAPRIADYPDLCKPEYKRKTTVRLRRQTLLAFAFATGKDPFKLYDDPKAYAALMQGVGKTLAGCKTVMKPFWENRDMLMGGLRSTDTVGAIMWEKGARQLHSENADIRFVPAKSGAIGWIDTYAIPLKGRNDEAAYAWINFNQRPEIAAKVSAASGDFTASKDGMDAVLPGPLKTLFADSFTPKAIANIKWYPHMPPGIEDIEAVVLEQVRSGGGKDAAK